MQKLGCTVEAVWDGQQAVDAVLATYDFHDHSSGNHTRQQQQQQHGENNLPPRRFDAVLMDCQVSGPGRMNGLPIMGYHYLKAHFSGVQITVLAELEACLWLLELCLHTV